MGAECSISSRAELIGPAVIGPGTEIRSGALIRENVLVGEHCVIGNSTELKNCVLFDQTQAPHFNYVGDSWREGGDKMQFRLLCRNHDGPEGETILEYSLFYAQRAGFTEVIFIISRAMEVEFRSRLLDRIWTGLFIKQVHAEFYLPAAVQHLVMAGVATVRVLRSPECWFGLTYKPDIDGVRKELRRLVEAGVYPPSLRTP